MSVVTGIVQGVNVKPVDGKTYVKYGLKVNDKWYNGISFDGKATDKNKNEYKEGYMIELHLETNDKGFENVNQKQSVILVGGEQPKAAAQAAPTQTRTVVQDSIWLTSLNAACVFAAGRPDMKSADVVKLTDYFVEELKKR